MTHSYGRILFILAGIGLVILFAWKIAQRVDAFFFPWANEKSGQPLLTGTWVGTFTLPDSTPHGIFLEVHRWREDSNKPCADCQVIEGRARICDADEDVTDYRLSGVPLDRTAKRLRLKLTPTTFGQVQNEAVGLTGAWQQNNLQLQLALKNVPVDKNIPLPMARGSEGNWRSACAALAQS